MRFPYSAIATASSTEAAPRKLRHCGVSGGNHVRGPQAKTSSAIVDVFEVEWEKFLEIRHDIQKMVDPVYLAFTCPGGLVPAGFAAHIAASDARAGVVGVDCSDGTPSTSIFAVASNEWAAYVAGRMCSEFPGVMCHRMVSNVALAY